MSLRSRAAFRQISLSPLGRSGALLIGTLSPDDGASALTVTAATPRPMRLSLPGIPTQGALQTKLEAEIPQNLYCDDIHGAPAWRRHVTLQFAEEIRGELAGNGAGVPCAFWSTARATRPSRGSANACAHFCGTSDASA
jgi:hypothetical protein